MAIIRNRNGNNYGCEYEERGHCWLKTSTDTIENGVAASQKIEK